MIDISRDPRWGRIAESLGEDPYLASQLAVAMVEGFQGDDLADAGTIAATAKHFAGYGASESGRDYATVNIPENELRNVYFPPFKAAVDAGVVSLMAAFSDLDGVPATGNEFLMREVLRDEWDFSGFVVSDWDSVRQLAIHGLTENDKESVYEAVTAGVDMEMAGQSYVHQSGGIDRRRTHRCCDDRRDGCQHPAGQVSPRAVRKTVYRSHGIASRLRTSMRLRRRGKRHCRALCCSRTTMVCCRCRQRS